MQEYFELKNTKPLHLVKRAGKHACDHERDLNEEERIIKYSTMFGNLDKKQTHYNLVKHHLRKESNDLESYLDFEQREASDILMTAILNPNSDDNKKMWNMIKAFKLGEQSNMQAGYQYR